MPNSYSQIQLLRFIAQLLHPTTAVNTSFFPASQFFWDRMVKIGSSHLVLPAIYGALKRKKLDRYAPKDLVSYLQEITDLNFKRNTAILKQIDFLSKVFNNNQIDHVFLKGAAMLITKPYNVKSDRMIGDIDILVSERDVFKAQDILIKEGFKPVSKDFNLTKGLNSAKHLDRIVHPNFIAAVEIHRKLLDHTYKKIIFTTGFINRKIQYSDSFCVPSKIDLWQHAILNWQYNDGGMARNSLGLRTVLDVVHLEPKGLIHKIDRSSLATKHFYSLLSLYFDFYSVYYPLMKLLYKYKLKYKSIRWVFELYFKIYYLINLGIIRFGNIKYVIRIYKNPKVVIKKIYNFLKK